jgi:hypothetical protein
MLKRPNIKNLPEYFFSLGLFLVFLSIAGFYLIDLKNIFGLRDILFDLKQDYFFFSYTPFFFQHWARNGGFVEIIQFLVLGACALISAFVAGKIKTNDFSGSLKKTGNFWLIMSVVFILLLTEDAGDVRHTFLSYIQAIFNEPDQGVMGTFAELFYFAILGGIPFFALIYYWKSLKSFLKTKIYLLIGFVFYAFSAFISFIGTAFEGLLEKNLYDVAGEKFYQFSLKIGDACLGEKWQAWEESGQYYLTIKFMIMDSLIEENIELIAVFALLASVSAFLIYLFKGKNQSK